MTAPAISPGEPLEFSPGVASSALGWLQDFIAWVERCDAVASVIGIGSAVRPVSESNDLDLIVIARKTVDRESLRIPAEVDLRIFRLDSVDQLIAGGNDALVWALRFGRPLYDAEGFWHTLLLRWGDNLPLPSAEISRERARIAERYTRELRQMGDQDAAAEQELSALTHRGWVVLLEHGVLPASRPEMPAQLRACGSVRLARELELALSVRKETSQLAV